MKYLLDTHVFYWWDHEPTKLSATAMSAIKDPANDIYVSTINIWKVVVKSALNKLTLQNPIEQLVQTQCRVNAFRLLAVEAHHAYALRGLPPSHKDPFDRMLVAQAIADGLTLITVDAIFAHYPVPTLW
jgi:PIN domain nuclease of toxin-antitoxin system